MFLGVSGSVRAVDMDETQRLELGARLREVRNSRFKGSKKAAYTAAGVNSATWDRAEAGESIKEHTRVAIVSALWPETGGDWMKIPAPEDLTTWADMANPRYDAKHMARRIDELERKLEERDPDFVIETEDGVMVIEVKAHPGRESLLQEKLVAALARALEDPSIKELVFPDASIEIIEDMPLAARRGSSRGKALRRAQDKAGEENQDDGGDT